MRDCRPRIPRVIVVNYADHADESAMDLDVMTVWSDGIGELKNPCIVH